MESCFNNAGHMRPVHCSTTLDCSTTSANMMSPRECCVISEGSLAYFDTEEEQCHVCIGKLIYNYYRQTPVQ